MLECMCNQFTDHKIYGYWHPWKEMLMGFHKLVVIKWTIMEIIIIIWVFASFLQPYTYKEKSTYFGSLTIIRHFCVSLSHLIPEITFGFVLNAIVTTTTTTPTITPNTHLFNFWGKKHREIQMSKTTQLTDTRFLFQIKSLLWREDIWKGRNFVQIWVDLSLGILHKVWEFRIEHLPWDIQSSHNSLTGISLKHTLFLFIFSVVQVSSTLN